MLLGGEVKHEQYDSKQDSREYKEELNFYDILSPLCLNNKTHTNNQKRLLN